MLNLEWSLIIWGKYRTNGRFFLVAVFSWHFTYVVVVLMESVFMHFDANYVSIMCEWAIVNYRTGILGTSVTKQKGKDLAVVHTWSLTIGPLLYLVPRYLVPVPGTIPYHTMYLPVGYRTSIQIMAWWSPQSTSGTEVTSTQLPSCPFRLSPYLVCVVAS